MAELKRIKPNKCKACGNKFTPRYKTIERHCSYTCAKKNQKPKKISFKAIKSVSNKRKKEIPKYRKQRKQFLEKPENQICFIDGCGKRANTIEHIRGRKGYADDWARDNGISLYLDERFWKPCCLEHNLELERNIELSKKYQLSKLTGEKK